MLKILYILFSIITLVLAGYGVFTKDFQFQAFMILFLGLTMLLAGLQEFKKDSKLWGWMLIGVFVFSMFVAIQSFMLNYSFPNDTLVTLCEKASKYRLGMNSTLI